MGFEMTPGAEVAMSLKWMVVVGLALVSAVVLLPAARADRPSFVFPDSCCFYNDQTVRTVVPPAAFPNTGLDNFYAFPSGGATGQEPVVAVAPGAVGYHGGHWKFFAATWNPGSTPTLLTSEAAVLAAQSAGLVTLTRVPANDFLCPIQF
jgi:hypothetical protein